MNLSNCRKCDHNISKICITLSKLYLSLKLHYRYSKDKLFIYLHIKILYTPCIQSIIIKWFLIIHINLYFTLWGDKQYIHCLLVSVSTVIFLETFQRWQFQTSCSEFKLKIMDIFLFNINLYSRNKSTYSMHIMWSNKSCNDIAIVHSSIICLRQAFTTLINRIINFKSHRPSKWSYTTVYYANIIYTHLTCLVNFHSIISKQGRFTLYAIHIHESLISAKYIRTTNVDNQCGHHNFTVVYKHINILNMN